MDKEINIDWTLIAESLGGDQDAIAKAKQLADTDEAFKSALSEVTEIWNQSNSMGQDKKRLINASQLDNKVNEIWSKILEVESEETKMATFLEDNSNEVNSDVLNIWNTANSLGAKQKKSVSSQDMDAAMAKMLLRMNVSSDQKQTPSLKVERPSSSPTKERAMTFPKSMAAAVVILLTVGLSMFYYLDSGKVDMLHMETGNTTAMLKLPDGTKVWLNKNSTIHYPKSFGEGDRNVRMEGDAFFEVKRDVEHAFHIITDDATTTVLGTSFHLAQNKVEVVTGKVRFESKNSGEYVVLTKNEEGTISDGVVSKTTFDNVNAASLMQAELSFEGESIGQTIKVLAKAYGKNIVIETTSLNDRKFTGSFKYKSFDTVIAQLSEVVGCSYETLEDGTTVLK